jgi:hypothetical protein
MAYGERRTASIPFAEAAGRAPGALPAGTQ